MQITIKDSLIKLCIADYVEDVLGQRNPKLTRAIFNDPKFQKRMASALARYLNEGIDGDVIYNRLGDIEIPQLDQAFQASFRG